MTRYVVWSLILVVVPTATGCFPFRDGYSYFPPGAINLPTGTTTREWQAAQADKSRSDGLVLYEASWIDGSDRLGPAAIDRLATACSSDFAPLGSITLEPAQDASLNDRRVQAIMDFANNRGIALSPESIVLVRPDGNEIYGEESVQVAREMMQGNRRTRNQNVFGAGTGGIFGGPSNGSFNGFPGTFTGGR